MIVAGKILDRVGCASFLQLRSGGPAGVFVERTHVDARIELRHTQAAEIPVNFEHSPPNVGSVIHAETLDGNTWVVASTDRSVPYGQPLYFSARVSGQRDRAELEHVAIVERPAIHGLGRIAVLDDLDERTTLRLARLDAHLSGLLTRARLAIRDRGRGAGVQVVDRHQPKVERLEGGGYLVDGERPHGQLWYRPGQILSVRGRAVRYD